MITKSQINWINENLPIEQYLEELEIDVPPNGKVFCPFHYNVNTPAAKVYLSETAGNGGRLYCYSERRSYTTFDVIRLLKYQDSEIHAMVPKEFWYAVENEQPIEAVKIPVIDFDARDAVIGGAFGVLDQLAIMWENPSKYKCRGL